jgi:hypothetical protein
MYRETFIEKLTEVQQTVEQLLAQLRASEHDNSRLTSTGRAENTGRFANAPASPASRWSGASSRAFRSPRAWAPDINRRRHVVWLKPNDEYCCQRKAKSGSDIRKLNSSSTDSSLSRRSPCLKKSGRSSASNMDNIRPRFLPETLF